MRKLYTSLMIPFTIYAQDLSELISRSLENQLVNSSKQNIDGLNLEYESIKSGYLPNIVVGSSYIDTSKETAAIPNNGVVSYATINYTLYDGGAKKSIYNKYKSNIKSANEDLNTLKNNLTLEVINYYYSYATLQALKEAKIKECEQLKEQQNRLEKFYEVGTTTLDEVQKIISRYQAENLALHQLELSIQRVLHNLEYITNQEVDITLGSTIIEPIIKENLLRSELKALEYEIQSSLDTAKEIKSANYPNITLNNTYSFYNQNYNNQIYQDNSIDSQNIFTLNLSWRLYDFDTNSKKYQSAIKKHQALKSKYEYEKNKANIDLKLAKKEYKIAKLKISSATASLKAATSAYETIEAKYKNGLVDSVAYLEALSEKYRALALLKESQYDLEIKKANIIYHSGENLKGFVK